mmetsp:Transcript_43037/g.129999  ORF Transcript_43037/g.129999 Transcript_43037/m.129999 type:complete len:243 (-) Transcript_43037:489-1217(-)
MHKRPRRQHPGGVRRGSDGCPSRRDARSQWRLAAQWTGRLLYGMTCHHLRLQGRSCQGLAPTRSHRAERRDRRDGRVIGKAAALPASALGIHDGFAELRGLLLLLGRLRVLLDDLLVPLNEAVALRLATVLVGLSLHVPDLLLLLRQLALQVFLARLHIFDLRVLVGNFPVTFRTARLLVLQFLVQQQHLRGAFLDALLRTHDGQQQSLDLLVVLGWPLLRELFLQRQDPVVLALLLLEHAL